MPCVTTHKGVLDRTAAPLIVRYRLVPCTRLTHTTCRARQAGPWVHQSVAVGREQRRKLVAEFM